MFTACIYVYQSRSTLMCSQKLLWGKKKIKILTKYIERRGNACRGFFFFLYRPSMTRQKYIPFSSVRPSTTTMRCDASAGQCREKNSLPTYETGWRVVHRECATERAVLKSRRPRRNQRRFTANDVTNERKSNEIPKENTQTPETCFNLFGGIAKFLSRYCEYERTRRTRSLFCYRKRVYCVRYAKQRFRFRARGDEQRRADDENVTLRQRPIGCTVCWVRFGSRERTYTVAVIIRADVVIARLPL